MADRNKELAVNTVILGIGQLIPKFLAVILLPLLTTYLSTDEYGSYDLILSVASLLIPIVTLQIQQAVFRYLLSSKRVIDKTKYVTSAISYFLISSAICYPIIFAFLKLMRFGMFNSIMICVLFCSESLYMLLGQIVRGLGFNIKYSASVVVYSTVNLLFTAFMLVVLHMGLEGIIVSLAVGYLSADLYMIVASGMIKHYKISCFDKETLTQLLKFSIPIVPSSVALWVVNLSDRLIIIHFMGAAANGIYAVANKVPSLYSTAYNIFNLAWTETAARASDDGNPAEYYTKLFHVLFDFLIGVMLGLIAVTPLIFKVLVRGNYGEAFYQVPILYFGIFFSSLVNFYSGIYIALKRTKQVGYSSVAGAILNALINIFLIKEIGLYAASISTALSFLIIALYRAYDLGKVIKIKYSLKDILLGLVCFITASGFLFVNKFPMLLACWIIAICYNIKKNIPLLKKIVRKFMKH